MSMATDTAAVPHGGSLVHLMADTRQAAALRAPSRDWPSWDLTPRQLCDLELLLNGAFSPLNGFLGREDYDAVCRSMRLADGTLWPIPIVLDVPDQFANGLAPGMDLALRDAEGVMVAVLHIGDVWHPDRLAEAEAVFGTSDPAHPGVAHLLERTNPVYVGGGITGLQLPGHYDFTHLRQTPSELRADFAMRGWRRVIAFQTRNPMHRAHYELTRRAAEESGANLLIHPVVGMTKPGDVDHYTRVRCYEALLPRYPDGKARLSLLPLAMRMAGPREAVWHAIIRKNYGCTHFIVGRDHAGPGSDTHGRPYYDPYAAQQLLSRHDEELGVTIVPFKMMVYVPARSTYAPSDRVPDGEDTLSISGTELRRQLAVGDAIPDWFTFDEVAGVLRQAHPPRHQQGFTVFFTGLSGAGKSTVANVLHVRLLEIQTRRVTLLDGDLVRKHLSSELGFSREHRDLNIRRIGYVASEITKNGGVAICAPIAPYDQVRKDVRATIDAVGGFVLVHVATPLEICEQRDRKGLYSKARAGVIKEFTGVSDPYEPPDDADVVIDTTGVTAAAAAERILEHLAAGGFVRVGSPRVIAHRPDTGEDDT